MTIARRLAAPIVLAIAAIIVVACDRVVELTPALPDSGIIQPDAAPDAPDDADVDAPPPDSIIDAALGLD